MESKTSQNIINIDDLPIELIILAYHPVAMEFGIGKYAIDGENKEYWDMLCSVTSRNLEAVIGFKLKSNQKEYENKVKSMQKRFSGDTLEVALDALEKEKTETDEKLYRYLEIKSALVENLKKIAQDDIQNFNDGIPVIKKDTKSHNFLFLNSTIMMASTDSVVWVFSERDSEPKTDVVFTKADRAKAESALHREPQAANTKTK